MKKYSFIEVNDSLLKPITDIYNYYVKNTVATFHIKPLSIYEMKDILYFQDPRFKSFAIINENKVSGYCILGQYKNREAYDECGEIAIYLDPMYCGKGIGSIAIDFLEDEAVRNKFHVLVAGICGENERSIKLFEKKGYIKCACFKEVGKKFGRLLDVVYYQKIL